MPICFISLMSTMYRSSAEFFWPALDLAHFCLHPPSFAQYLFLQNHEQTIPQPSLITPNLFVQFKSIIQETPREDATAVVRGVARYHHAAMSHGVLGSEINNTRRKGKRGQLSSSSYLP